MGRLSLFLLILVVLFFQNAHAQNSTEIENKKKELIEWIIHNKRFPNFNSKNPAENKMAEATMDLGNKFYVYMTLLPDKTKNHPKIRYEAIINLLIAWLSAHNRRPNITSSDQLEKKLAELLDILQMLKPEHKKGFPKKNPKTRPSYPQIIAHYDEIMAYQAATYLQENEESILRISSAKKYIINNWIADNNRWPHLNSLNKTEKELAAIVDQMGGKVIYFDSYLPENIKKNELIHMYINPMLYLEKWYETHISAPKVDSGNLFERELANAVESRRNESRTANNPKEQSPVDKSKNSKRSIHQWIKKNKKWPSINSLNNQERSIAEAIYKLGGKKKYYHSYLSKYLWEEPLLRMYIDPMPYLENWYKLNVSAPNQNSSNIFEKELALAFQEQFQKAVSKPSSIPQSSTTQLKEAIPLNPNDVNQTHINLFISEHKRWPYRNSENPSEQILAQWIKDKGGIHQVLPLLDSENKKWPAIMLHISPKKFFDSWFLYNKNPPNINSKDPWEQELARYAHQNPSCDPRVFQKFKSKN